MVQRRSSPLSRVYDVGSKRDGIRTLKVLCPKVNKDPSNKSLNYLLKGEKRVSQKFSRVPISVGRVPVKNTWSLFKDFAL